MMILRYIGHLMYKFITSWLWQVLLAIGSWCLVTLAVIWLVERYTAVVLIVVIALVVVIFSITIIGILRHGYIGYKETYDEIHHRD